MHARLAIAPVLVAAAALAGCRTATIVVPAGLDAAAAPITVHGLNPRATNKPIDFGPYHVTVREGWERSQSVEFLGIGIGKAMRPYRFELTGGETAVSAACSTAAAELWRGSVSVELPVDAVLGCTLTAGGTVYELRLNTDRKGALIGSLRGGPTGYLEIRSLHSIEGGAWRVSEPVGFVLRRDGTPIAVAETINAGRVWLPPSFDAAERDAIAAAVTALLFFTPAEVR